MWTIIIIFLNVIVLVIGIYEIILKSKEGKPANKTIIFTACAIIVLNGAAAIIDRVVPSKTERELIEIKEEQRRQSEKLDKLVNVEPTYPGKVMIKERPDSLSRKSDEDTLSTLFKDIIKQMLHQPLRYNLEIEYFQTIEKILNKKVLRVINNYKWTYKNPYNEPMIFPQRFENTVEPIAGIRPEDLFKVTRWTVDGEIQPLVLQKELTKDGMYRFHTSYDLELKDSIQCELETEKVIPYKSPNYLVAWMPIPTKDFRFIYRHPSSFIPIYYVFGLGDGPIHEKQELDLDIWSYEGWLLPKQGFMLFWQDKE